MTVIVTNRSYTLVNLLEKYFYFNKKFITCAFDGNLEYYLVAKVTLVWKVFKNKSTHDKKLIIFHHSFINIILIHSFRDCLLKLTRLIWL